MASEISLTPEQFMRFWNKVDAGGPGRCWNWIGWTNASGHPRFDLGDQKVLATHVMLALYGRPRPAAPFDNALHGDDCTPACCNPHHLRWGTHKQNSEDRERLGRRRPARGEGHGMSKIDEDVVRDIRRSNQTQRTLAERHGLSRVWVGKIKRRAAWAHVT